MLCLTVIQPILFLLTTSSTQRAALLLLNKLCTPKTSKLSRKRTLQENPSKGKCRRGSQSNPGGLSFACFSSRLQNCLEDYVEENKY